MASLVYRVSRISHIGFSHVDSGGGYNKVRPSYPGNHTEPQLIITLVIHRLLGYHIVEDSEPAWFPANELREVHGIVPHEPSQIERNLFCIQVDGSEGFCCPTYTIPEDELQEEE